MMSYKKLINMRKIDDVIKSIFRSEPNVFGQDLMTSYEKLINMRMFKSVRKKVCEIKMRQNENRFAPETAFSHYSYASMSSGTVSSSVVTLTLVQASTTSRCRSDGCLGFHGSGGELKLENTVRVFSREWSYWTGESQPDQRMHNQVAQSGSEGGVSYM